MTLFKFLAAFFILSFLAGLTVLLRFLLNYKREVLEGNEGGCPESGECFESSSISGNLTCTITVLDSKEGKEGE